jgi:hypothetical protein
MMQPRENQLTLPGYWSHSEGSSDARGPEFHGTESIVVSREGLHHPCLDVGESYSLEQTVPPRNNSNREV